MGKIIRLLHEIEESVLNVLNLIIKKSCELFMSSISLISL